MCYVFVNFFATYQLQLNWGKNVFASLLCQMSYGKLGMDVFGINDQSVSISFNVHNNECGLLCSAHVCHRLTLLVLQLSPSSMGTRLYYGLLCGEVL